MALAKRGLGRGLSALIPDEEMELFRQVARNQAPEQAPTEQSLAGSTALASSNGTKSAKNETRGKKGRRTGDAAKAPSRNEILSRPVVASAETAFAETASAKNKTASKGSDATNGEANGESDESLGHTTDDVVASLLALDDIEPNPFQPRRTFDEAELNDLASSLREHGIIQPIVVRPLKNGSTSYQLVAGERRWRAAQRAGIKLIPAIVRPINDLQSLELALIENVQRHDISAIDAALAYRRLADEFQLSQEHIATRVGKSRSAVANTMRLLDLQPEIRKAIEDGHLSEGHGRAILLAQGEGARRALFRRAMRDHLSVREVERLAREKFDGTVGTGDTSRNGEEQSSPVDNNAKVSEQKAQEQLVERLQKKLGARLQIKASVHGGKARGGKIVIEYSSEAELHRLSDILMSG